MASSSGSQERILALLQLVEDLDYVIAAVPHDVSSVTGPMSAFYAVLNQFQKAQAIQNLQLGDSAETILNRMHQFCTTLRNDITRAWPSGSPDWESFKSQDRDISKISLFMKPQATTFYAAIVEANRDRFLFREDMAELHQAATEDAIQHYSQQLQELEEKVGGSPEYKLVKILLETVNSMERLLPLVLRHRRRHDDLEADWVTLKFLANNTSWITEVEILSPVIVCWRRIIDKSIAAIEAQGAGITGIQKLTSSSRLLRTTVLSHILSCLYRSPRVFTSQVVRENYDEMLSDLQLDLQDLPAAESLLDKDILTACSAIYRRAKNELVIQFLDDNVPRPRFRLSTWDEYYSQHEADASQLLIDGGILFETDRKRAYRNLRRSQNTKEKRLVDLAGMLGEEPNMELDLAPELTMVLTEGSFYTFETILDELS